MAGIGFELKKIFKERSVVNVLRGALYSTFTILGPMLIVILGFVILNVILEYSKTSFGERDLFVSIVLYVFIFSLIFASPLSAIISRYIADSIFEERSDGIMPCFYAGLLVNMAVATLVCVPFCLVTVIKGGADPLIILVGACMFFALFLIFYTMTYVLAIKEYRKIAFAFTVGVTIAVGLSCLLAIVLGLGYTLSVLTGAATGFSYIALRLFSLVRQYFTENNRDYKVFLRYLWRYRMLFFTNLCYILGLYVHNFVFWWHSEYVLVVATTLRSAPVYDTATFLAMLTSVSTMIIFTVRVEINFHERYQKYCQEIIGGIGDDILKAKKNMFKTLEKEIIYIVQTQMIISVAIFLVIMIFGSNFGFGGLLLYMYPSLAAGYIVIFIMYCLIIFLYYFDDGRGAFVTALTFVVFTAIASYFATFLEANFCGIGTLIGAFAAWTVGFFRLKHIEKNLDKFVFLRGSLIRKVPLSKKAMEKLEESSKRVLNTDYVVPVGVGMSYTANVIADTEDARVNTVSGEEAGFGWYAERQREDSVRAGEIPEQPSSQPPRMEAMQPEVWPVVVAPKIKPEDLSAENLQVAAGQYAKAEEPPPIITDEYTEASEAESILSGVSAENNTERKVEMRIQEEEKAKEARTVVVQSVPNNANPAEDDAAPSSTTTGEPVVETPIEPVVKTPIEPRVGVSVAPTPEPASQTVDLATGSHRAPAPIQPVANTTIQTAATKDFVALGHVSGIRLRKTLFGYNKEDVERQLISLESQQQEVLAQLKNSMSKIENENATLKSKLSAFEERENYIARAMVDLSMHIEASENASEERKTQMLKEAEEKRQQIIEEGEQYRRQAIKEADDNTQKAMEDVQVLKEKLESLKRDSVTMLNELTRSVSYIEKKSDNFTE